jgi:hypothetical protein
MITNITDFEIILSAHSCFISIFVEEIAALGNLK